MKKSSKIHTMSSIRSRFIGMLFAMFTVISATAGSIFATPPEDAKIWRVQMRFQTANVGDAGTDDSVRVQLNSSNRTWLDYSHSDFQQNNTFTYDLKMDGINQISDLKYINISKTGSDGLALKSFALLINNREIYTEIFPGSARWLDNDSGSSPNYIVSGYAMRQDASWLSYTQPSPPLVIPRAELESRIEGLVGDFITGNRLYWGNKYGRAYVEVAKKPNALNTLNVDLDLSADVPGFDPEVDVDFDIEVRCVRHPVLNKNQITLDIKNVKVVVDSNWYAEVLSLGIYQYIDSYVNNQLGQALKGINISQNIGVPSCPVIDVDDDGDINFSLPRPVFPRAHLDEAGVPSSNRDES